MSGEPSLAAVEALAGAGRLLPVYLFALRQGSAFVERGLGEVVGKALSLLADGLPASLYEELAATILLATSRDDAQRDLLYRLAREATPDRREEFLDYVHRGVSAISAKLAFRPSSPAPRPRGSAAGPRAGRCGAAGGGR